MKPTHVVRFTASGTVMVQARSQAEAEDLVKRGLKGWDGDPETRPDFEFVDVEHVSTGRDQED